MRVVPPNNPIIPRIISITKATKMINAIIADKTAPKRDKISPDTERPFTVLDLIKSKINKLIPSIEKNAEGIKQSESR